MEEEKKEIKKNLKEDLVKQVDKQIEEILDEGIHPDNIEMLGELVDIHKDIKNEDYWESKEEVYKMKYGNEFGTYGRRGYREMDNYGRRGRYRGGNDAECMEKIEEIMEHYGNYNEARRDYNRGNYNASSDKIRSLEYMLESGVDFFEMLEEQADSPEEMEIVKKYFRKIGNM